MSVTTKPILLVLAITAGAGAAFGQDHQVPRKARSSDSVLAIKVRIDGHLVTFKGTTPVMEGSRILVPLRGVFEQIGATLTWDPETRVVTANGGGTSIILPVGKSMATIGGKPTKLDQPAMIIDNVTFVPLRFLSEALGAKVEWMTADRTVEITTNSSDTSDRKAEP